MSQIDLSGSSVKLNVYSIISDKVEAGVRFGLHRAYKHTDEPDRDTVETYICQAVLDSLCEVLQFE